MANEFKVRKGLVINGSGSALLDVQGSVGQLTTITDSLSGSLFSINDISGIPVMEAFSDGRVKIGAFGNEAIKISGSFATTTGSLQGTASYATNALSASNALSSSYALSSSFAFLANTASYVATSSYAISASYADNFNAGYARVFAQTSPAVTWSFTHNLNSFVPLVQVYDLAYNQLIPATIVNTSLSGSSIYFANAQAGYAVISTGGITVTGSNAILSQTTPATTWSFYHNLNTQFPVFTVFDSSNNVMMPLQINATNASSASIYFSTPQTGTVVAANCGLSGSGFILAQTASYVKPLNQTVIITGSLSISSSGAFNNVGSANFTGSVFVTGSMNVVGDITASNARFSNLITAQTLVVQTVSSSVTYSSGSNVFGNSLANTHQFTGSVLVTGSVNVNSGSFYVGSNNQIGINNNSPQSQFVVGKIGNNATLEINLNNTGYSRIFSYDRGATASTNLILQDPGGNVGIGTTAPSSSLHIYGSTYFGSRLILERTAGVVGRYSMGVSTANNQFDITDEAQGNLTRFSINSSGNVGIGVINPTGQLSIKNQISNGSTPIASYAATSGVEGQNFLNGYYASNSDGLGPYPRYLDIVSVGSPDGTNGGSNIRFFTNPIATSSPAIERMRIGSQGNLGLGVGNDPDIRLFVKGQNSSSTQYAFLAQNSSANNLLIVRNDGWCVVNANKSSEALQVNNIRNGGASDYALVTTLGASDNNTSNYHYIAATGGADKYYLYGNGTYTTVSDARLKKNITTVTDTYLNKVKDLRIVNYNWNDQEDGTPLEFGMIAQEVEEIIPSIVHEGREHEDNIKYKGIQASVLPYILIKAIQEQQTLITALQEKLERNNIN